MNARTVFECEVCELTWDERQDADWCCSPECMQTEASMIGEDAKNDGEIPNGDGQSVEPLYLS